MAEHPAELENLTAEMDRLGLGDDADLSSFDFASLAKTIKHESSWVIQLETMDMVDASGNAVDPSQTHLPGLRPSFMIYCYDDKTRYRVTDNCIGLPSSDTVLKSVRRILFLIQLVLIILLDLSSVRLQSQSHHSNLAYLGFSLCLSS